MYKLMKAIRRLLGVDQFTFKPEPDPPIHIDPDPDMAPGTWSWECVEPGCGAGGTGEDQIIRLESMSHCLHTGHAVKGNHQ